MPMRSSRTQTDLLDLYSLGIEPVKKCRAFLWWYAEMLINTPRRNADQYAYHFSMSKTQRVNPIRNGRNASAPAERYTLLFLRY